MAPGAADRPGAVSRRPRAAGAMTRWPTASHIRRTWRLRPSWIVSSSSCGPSRRTRAGAVRPSSSSTPSRSARSARSDRAALDARAIGPRHLEARVGQRVGEVAVVGEQDQPGRVGVQPPDRVQALGRGHEVDDGAPAMGVARRRDDAGRACAARRRPARRARAPPRRRRRSPPRRSTSRAGSVHDLAVDGHPPVDDERLGRPPRGDARMGEVLGEAHVARDATTALHAARRSMATSRSRTTWIAASTGGRARISAATPWAASRYDGSASRRRTASRARRGAGRPRARSPRPARRRARRSTAGRRRAAAPPSGSPAARPIVTVPDPPWQTIAAACGMTSSCGTQRSRWTLAGTGSSSRRVGVAAHGHEHADRQAGQRVDRLAVDAGVAVAQRRHRAEGHVDQRLVAGRPTRDPAIDGGCRRLAEAQRRRRRRRERVLERRRHERQVGPVEEACSGRVGRQPEHRAQLVDPDHDCGDDGVHLALLRDADGDGRHAARLGRQRPGELGDLADDDVGPPYLAGGEGAGVRRTRVDAREDVADDAFGRRLRRVAHLLEDQVALGGRRIVEGPQWQPLGADHRCRPAWSGDEDVGAGAAEGVGERDQRAEVAGAGFGRHEDAHAMADAPAGVRFQ